MDLSTKGDSPPRPGEHCLINLPGTVIHLGNQPLDPEPSSSSSQASPAVQATVNHDLSAIPNLTGCITIVKGPLCAGGFCDVFTGELTSERGAEKVALKMLRVFNSEAHVVKMKKKFRREVNLWCWLCHDHVLPFYGTFELDEHLFMVSPWAEGGNSLEYLRRSPSHDRGLLLWQVASALEYLHSGKDMPQIVHGDIKADNVLISRKGDALLCDFGLSHYVEEIISRTGSSSAGRAGGHSRFMAPELLNPPSDPLEHSRPTPASDVFAFASLMIQIYTEKQPFENLREVQAITQLMNGKIPLRPADTVVLERGFDDHKWILMTDCWKYQPSERPTMEEVMDRMTPHAPIEFGTIGSTMHPGMSATTGNITAKRPLHSNGDRDVEFVPKRRKLAAQDIPQQPPTQPEQQYPQPPNGYRFLQNQVMPPQQQPQQQPQQPPELQRPQQQDQQTTPAASRLGFRAGLLQSAFAQFAHMSVEEMRKHGLPEQSIHLIETNRPQLQRQWKQQQQLRASGSQATGTSAVGRASQQMPPASSMIPPGPQQLQHQAQQNVMQGQTDFQMSPQLVHLLQLMQGGAPGPINQDPPMAPQGNGTPSHTSAPYARPTLQQMNAAMQFIRLTEEDNSSKWRNFPLVQVSEHEKGLYMLQFDQLWRLVQEVEQELIMYHALFGDEPSTTKLMTIIVTTKEQRRLLATPAAPPQYILSLQIVRSLLVALHSTMDRFYEAISTMAPGPQRGKIPPRHSPNTPVPRPVVMDHDAQSRPRPTPQQFIQYSPPVPYLSTAPDVYPRAEPRKPVGPYDPVRVSTLSLAHNPAGAAQTPPSAFASSSPTSESWPQIVAPPVKAKAPRVKAKAPRVGAKAPPNSPQPDFEH